MENLKSFKMKSLLVMLLLTLAGQSVWAEVVTTTMEVSDNATTPATVLADNQSLSTDYYPNWIGFKAPTVSIYTGTGSDKELVNEKYQILYYIDGQENATTFSTDATGNQITVDEVTGTAIRRYNGEVTIGDKMGEVTIRIVAKVKAAFENSYTPTLEKLYKINIKKIDPTASVNLALLSIGVWKDGTTVSSNVLKLPTPSIVFTEAGTSRDVSEAYDISFEPKAGDETYLSVDDMALTVQAKTDQDYKTPVNATIQAKFTPKTGYADSYETETVDIPVTISYFEPGTSTKLTASLELEGITANENKDAAKNDANTLHWSRWNDRNTQHPLPTPIVRGSNGDDLSKNGQISICYFAVEDNTILDDCSTNYEVWQAGETTSGNINRESYLSWPLNQESVPKYQSYKPGLLKIGVFAYLTTEPGDISQHHSPQTQLGYWYKYDKETTIKDNTKEGYYPSYTKTDFCRITPVKYFYIDVMKRSPELVFDPDPSSMIFSTADKINMNSRFELTGRIGDENDGTAGTLSYDVSGDDTFWYSFEFSKDSGIKVNNWPHYERMVALDESGNPVVATNWNWDKGGEPIYTEEQLSRIVKYRYTSVKGFGTDNLWSITFTKEGPQEIIYTILPWNHARWDIGTAKTYTYNVTKAKNATLHVDPEELVASISQAGFHEPEAWVTDNFGDEVSSDYTFTFTVKSSTETGSTKTSVDGDGGDGIGPKHEVAIGNSVGDVVITVTATTTNEMYTAECKTLTKDYTIHILNTDEDTNPLYEIISSKDEGAQRDSENTGTEDNDYAKDKVMGKMHFIRTGRFFSGYTVSGVPGIDIRFGKYDGSAWEVREDGTNDVGSYDNNNDKGVHTETHVETNGIHNKFIGDGTPVELNEDGIATGGHFYEFYARTNGFLVVDARWEVGQTYVLIDFDYPDRKLEFAGDGTKGDHMFNMPLIEDHSYHLYCKTGGQINMHGFSFEPAFINITRVGSDKKSDSTSPVTNGSAFLSGLPNVPILTVVAMPEVEYSSDNTNKAIVENNGTVKPKEITFADNPNYVTIRGKVKSSIKSPAGHDIYKWPSYNLVIADIPTYKLGADINTDGTDAGTYAGAAGQVVTTNNIATPIRMTYGGWKHSYSYTAGEKTSTKAGDTYKNKGEYGIGGFTADDTQFNKIVDGFSFSNVCDNNPSDENGLSNYKSYKTGYNNMKDAYYMNTFKLPAHGAYWRFEPQTSGTLFVYLVQNGICSYTGDPHSLTNTDKRYYGLDWKPLYIVDETGSHVDAANISGLNESVKAFLKGHASYTEGLIRCAQTDSLVAVAVNNNGIESESISKPGEDFAFLWEYKNSYGNDAGFDFNYVGNETAKNKFHESIKEAWTNAGTAQTIFQDEECKGYSMISKAYVRYAISVKAGKSYWVFQNASKPQFCGFGFIPDGFPSTNNGPAALTAKITDTEGSESGDDYENNHITFDVPYNVTYSGRTFKNKHWTSLCLPFAVSEYNFKKVFGNNASIMTFDNVSNDGSTLHLVQHNYRMLEAGRPYFVYPDFEGVEATGSKSDLVFEGVTFEGKADATDAHNEGGDDYKVRIITDPNNANGLYFVGTYTGEDMPIYSYYVNGKVYRTTKETHCGKYRGYLKNKTSDTNLARLQGTSYETPYEDVEEKSVPTSVIGIPDGNIMDVIGKENIKGVYTIDGKKLSANVKDVKNLPAGAYIVNGKKQIIK